jgi:4-amino-4-deoxy-L-arabinose transferase-like glycosyltransferase
VNRLRKLWVPNLRDDRTIAVLLAVLTVVLLTATAPDIGLTWDEPAYIVASESYAAWMAKLFTRPRYALSAESIRHYWAVNHEHPPLNKVWGGLIWSVARFVLDDLTAHRLGNIVLVGVLVALLYRLVSEELNETAGLAAVGALLTMPRFFFHAHLAALDVPAAFVVFVTVFAFWRTREQESPAWDVLMGGIWGLAMATKINAVLLLPAMLLWAVLVQRRRYLFRRIVLMGIIGLPLSLGVWPWLYREFVPRLIEYVLFITVDHWPIGQYYLGRFYMPPPWHFCFVITLAVVPLTTTVLYVLGIIRVARQEALRAFGGLLVICALVPLLALAIGQTMVYDNDRLFMPAFPFLAALAGVGFDWLVRALRGRALALAAVTIVAFAPHVILAADLHPHLLSYYSEAIGGLPGAVRMGLETTYWCETYAEALPYLNAHARPGDAVWVENWSHDVLFYYQLHGLLDDRLRVAQPRRGSSVFYREGIAGHEIFLDDADFVVVQYRQTGFRDETKDWLQGRKPVHQLNHRGIPLLEIYEQ